MSKRAIYFVVVLIFLFNAEIFGQQKNVEKNTGFAQVKLKNVDFRSFKTGGFIKGKRLADDQLPAALTFRLSPVGLLSLQPYRVPVQNYAEQLSFFCRQEWKLEKATSIPLRFRLGSLAYTDYLEQKPNALKP